MLKPCGDIRVLSGRLYLGLFVRLVCLDKLKKDKHTNQTDFFSWNDRCLHQLLLVISIIAVFYFENSVHAEFW